MKIKDILNKALTTNPISDMDINNRVLVIDGTNNYKRCFSRASELSDKGYYVGGYVGFLKSMAFMIRSIAPSRVIIVFDGAGGSFRRKKLYSKYKSNRLKIRSYNREMRNDNIDESKSMEEQFKRLIMYLYKLPVTVISIDNIEADDVISYISNNFNYDNLIISSTDKDFYQLVNDKVTIYDPISKTEITTDSIIEKYNCSPNNFIYYKSLLGDTSDNITGVKGIGEKTIKSKFGFLKKYERLSIEDILNNLDDKIKDKLNNDIDIFNRNIKLMDLKSPILDINASISISNFYNELKYSYTLDSASIRKYILNDGISRSFNNFDTWISSSFSKLNYLITKK